MNTQYNININKSIYLDKQQKKIKEFLFSCSLLCKELLLKNTKYYKQYVSIIAYYKLKVIGKHTENKTKTDKKTGNIVPHVITTDKFYVDEKYNRTKTTKLTKTVKTVESSTTPKVVKEPKITVLSTEFFSVDNNNFKKEVQEVTPEKFLPTKKPFHNFFSMCIEIYINEIMELFKDTAYNVELINTQGVFSKFVKFISESHNIESKFLQIEFDNEYTNKISVKINTIKNEMTNIITECFDSINKLTPNDKIYLANIFINFMYNIWSDICSYKVARIEKKMYFDVNTLYEALFSYYIKSDVKINLMEIKELFQLKEDEINLIAKSKKTKNKPTEQVVTENTVVNTPVPEIIENEDF